MSYTIEFETITAEEARRLAADPDATATGHTTEAIPAHRISGMERAGRDDLVRITTDHGKTYIADMAASASLPVSNS